MAPPSSEEWAHIRNLERDRKRNIGMAYVVSGVSTSDDAETNKKRYLTMGYVMDGWHISNDHEDFCALSRDEQKKIYEAADIVRFGSRPRYADMSPDSLDLPSKCYFVDNGQEQVPVQILEDSGTDINWISRQQSEKLGLSITATEKLLYIGFTGHYFESSECVQVPLLGKGNLRGQAQFYIAPPGFPVDMVVGRDFMEQHPDNLWEQQPPGKKMLLAIQPKIKKEEREAITANKAWADQQAAEVARQRQQRMQGRIASASTASSSPTLSGVSSFSKTGGQIIR